MKNNRLLKRLLERSPPLIGAYCFICGEKVKQGYSVEGELFICEADPLHQSPRAFIFDEKIQQGIQDDTWVHETVGAIVTRKINNVPYFVVFLRQKFPFLYTIPAGHAELTGSLQENVRREVGEETALDIQTITPLWPNESLRFIDPCRRGADVHNWHVFEVYASGKITLSNEGRIIGWYRKNELKTMITHQLLTEPSAVLLQKYWDLTRE